MSPSPPTNPHLSAAGRVSVLTRHHGANHPDTVAARAELRELRLAEEIAREAEADPPLTAEQRNRLAILCSTRPGVLPTRGPRDMTRRENLCVVAGNAEALNKNQYPAGISAMPMLAQAGRWTP